MYKTITISKEIDSATIWISNAIFRKLLQVKHTWKEGIKFYEATKLNRAPKSYTYVQHVVLKNGFSNLIKDFTLTQSQLISIPKSEAKNQPFPHQLMKKQKISLNFQTERDDEGGGQK